MILFSEPLLFCREFPPPAARAGAWYHASPGGARGCGGGAGGWPGAASQRGEPQRAVRAAAGARVSRSATAWPPTAGSSPFALFQLIGWPGRRILPGEARESPSNALTSGSVQPRARAHLHTRAHSCTPVHPCTSPISRAHYIQVTRLKQAGATRTYPLRRHTLAYRGQLPTPRVTLMGGKPGLLKRTGGGVAIFQTGLARVNCWVRVSRGSRAYSVSRT